MNIPDHGRYFTLLRLALPSLSGINSDGSDAPCHLVVVRAVRNQHITRAGIDGLRPHELPVLRARGRKHARLLEGIAHRVGRGPTRTVMDEAMPGLLCLDMRVRRMGIRRLRRMCRRRACGLRRHRAGSARWRVGGRLGGWRSLTKHALANKCQERDKNVTRTERCTTVYRRVRGDCGLPSIWLLQSVLRWHRRKEVTLRLLCDSDVLRSAAFLVRHVRPSESLVDRGAQLHDLCFLGKKSMLQ